MKYLILLLSVCCVAFSQEKRSLTHQDYDLWKRISSTKISKSGNLLINEIQTTTGRGDGYVQIDVFNQSFSTTFFNGTDARITPNEKFIIFLQQPHYDSIRAEKKREVKKEKQAKPILKIFSVEKQQLIDSIPRVKKYHVPKEADEWVVIEKYKDEKVKVKNEATSRKEKKKKKNKTVIQIKKKNEEADYAIV